MEPRIQRPPLRKLLVQLVALAAWTTALIVIDKSMGDGVAFVVAIVAYGGYLGWYFWRHRYR